MIAAKKGRITTWSMMARGGRIGIFERRRIAIKNPLMMMMQQGAGEGGGLSATPRGMLAAWGFGIITFRHACAHSYLKCIYTPLR